MPGFGAKLPLKLDNKDGPYSLIQDYATLMRQNLKMLVLTSPGERMMIPSYGVGLRNFLFENKGLNVKNDIKAKIREQVKIYLPFIDINDVQVSDADNNTLAVKIIYFVESLSLKDLVTINVDLN
jgi:phage baseplate assembly protein W|tara:strand:+ start:359 stop:733 length:375 start_codon:yes stop_codon:yes gene_type:complete